MKKQLIKGVPNDIVVIGGVGIAAAAGYYFYNRSKNKLVIDDAAPQLPESNGSSGTNTGTVTLNRNLVLKKGSKGNEVRELQRLLGVTVDGDFGNNTEAALVAKKGVKQISLAQYSGTADVNPNALAVGNRVMANKSPSVTIYKAVQNADKSYSLQSTPVAVPIAPFILNVTVGKEIGTIRLISTQKTKYLVSAPGTTTIIGWVHASEVKKI